MSKNLPSRSPKGDSQSSALAYPIESIIRLASSDRFARIPFSSSLRAISPADFSASVIVLSSISAAKRPFHSSSQVSKASPSRLCSTNCSTITRVISLDHSSASLSISVSASRKLLWRSSNADAASLTSSAIRSENPVISMISDAPAFRLSLIASSSAFNAFTTVISPASTAALYRLRQSSSHFPKSSPNTSCFTRASVIILTIAFDQSSASSVMLVSVERNESSRLLK